MSSRLPALLALGIGVLVAALPARAQEIAVPAQPANAAVAPAKAPEPADAVLAAASRRAKASGKNVLVVFHASWCGWCKRLESVLLNDPVMGKLIANSYEVVYLDVLEQPEKKSLENAGGGDLLNKWDGEKSGIPYYVVLDTSGKKLADSNRMPKNQNIGYPAAPEEIEAFEGILKATAPKMTNDERGQIIAHLKKNAPKPQQQ